MILYKLLKSLLFIYLLIAAMLFILQRSILFQATEELNHDFKTLAITSADNIIESLVTNEDANEIILYFAGNAENVVYSAQDFSTQFPNHSTYLMKYRGYSGAAGSSSEQALFADALVLFDSISVKPNTKITVIGRSLGSAVATYVATNREVKLLILVTPFDSMTAVAKSLLPIFPIDWLLLDRFDSKSRAESLKVPVLAISATNDEVIPFKNTESLVQTIPGNLLQTAAIRAGHNDIDLKPEYFNLIRRFININKMDSIN